MIRETMLDYHSKIICTAPAEEENGEGPWEVEDCTKAERHDELRLEYNLSWNF